MSASPVRLLLRRDLRLAWRRRADGLAGLFFFVTVVSLFPLAVSPETRTLRLIGPGVLWVAALLACLLTLPRLFSADQADGTLEQLLLLPTPLSLLVAAKALAHWLTSVLPLLAIAPLLAVQYALDASQLGLLLLTLLIGTPTLTLIGAVGAALTLQARGGALVLALLVLPLQVPVLIFGAAAVEAAGAGLAVSGHLSLLGASLLLALAVCPGATALALRIASE